MTNVFTITAYFITAIAILYIVFLLYKQFKLKKDLQTSELANKKLNKQVNEKSEELVKFENKVGELQGLIKYQKQKFADRQKELEQLEQKIDTEVLKRTSELHHALERSEENNRLKEIFLEKISREVRIPLNSILGFVNLLNDEHHSSIEREYYLKYIRNSGNNLLSLIDNIVDFTKLETGELKPEYKRCNLTLQITDLVDKYRSRIVRENPAFSIVFNKPTDAGESITDCKRIIHIVDQLIHNAVKFTKQGKVEVSYSMENNKHLIKVSDTGLGIESKYQDIIFERFYQIDSGTSEVFQGAGLGLTIVKGLVELLGGTIELKSEPGKGSEFTIAIPYNNTVEDIDKELYKNQDFDWKDKTILIAEDEDSNYFFLEAILKKTQARILRAADGIKFLELMNEKQKVDLVLLDIKMPGINGFNAIKVVRQQNIMIPVIAQTAFNQYEDKQRCLDSGCNDYLAKPIDKELLLSKIANFFNS